jgi:hypothetical protein
VKFFYFTLKTNFLKTCSPQNVHKTGQRNSEGEAEVAISDKVNGSSDVNRIRLIKPKTSGVYALQTGKYLTEVLEEHSQVFPS